MRAPLQTGLPGRLNVIADDRRAPGDMRLVIGFMSVRDLRGQLQNLPDTNS